MIDSIQMEAAVVPSSAATVVPSDATSPLLPPSNQQLLFHIMRMRQFQQSAAAVAAVKTESPSSPPRSTSPPVTNNTPQSAYMGLGHDLSPFYHGGHLPKRQHAPPHLDQPLDFSSKKQRTNGDSGDDDPSPPPQQLPSSADVWFQRHNQKNAAAGNSGGGGATAPGDGGDSNCTDINKHDSLGSDGHSDLSTSHSPHSSEDSPRLLHTSVPQHRHQMLHHRHHTINSEEEDDDRNNEHNNSIANSGRHRSPPRLAIPSPSPSPPPPHGTKMIRQKSYGHPHNGLLTTVSSLSGGLESAPLSSLMRPEYRSLLAGSGTGGLPMPPFITNPLAVGASPAGTAHNTLGNPFAMTLAMGGSPVAVSNSNPFHHLPRQLLAISPPPPAQLSNNGGSGPESMSELTKIAVTSNQKYAEFRENMLRNMESGRNGKGVAIKKTPSEDHNRSRSYSPATNSGGVATSTPTDTNSSGQQQDKDEAYWERRRKNNEAAKRSRDARRQKENEIAVRASFLEQENIQLKLELVQLRSELGSMREQMLHRQLQQAN